MIEGRSAWRLLLPLGLIFLGVALLCNNLGIAPGLWDFITGLWPLLLIGLGALLLFGRRFNWPWRRRASTAFSEPRGALRAVRLDLTGRAGFLDLEAGSASSLDLLSGKIPEGTHAEVLSSGETAAVRFRQEQSVAWWPWGDNVSNWELRLHPDVTWSLTIDGGGESEIDLSGLRVPNLAVDGHPGSLKIKLPRRGQTQVQVSGRLGDLTLRVPEGVAARIHQPTGALGSSKIDSVRFPWLGDVYQSPDFHSAADRVEIKLDSSLGELRIV
jgi:hypothetical protein